MKGTVKFYNATKAFGFITKEDGEDLFFHITGLDKIEDENGYTQPAFQPDEGTAVTFDIMDDDRGPKAVNVMLAEGQDME